MGTNLGTTPGAYLGTYAWSLLLGKTFCLWKTTLRVYLRGQLLGSILEVVYWWLLYLKGLFLESTLQIFSWELFLGTTPGSIPRDHPWDLTGSWGQLQGSTLREYFCGLLKITPEVYLRDYSCHLLLVSTPQDYSLHSQRCFTESCLLDQLCRLPLCWGLDHDLLFLSTEQLRH